MRFITDRKFKKVLCRFEHAWLWGMPRIFNASKTNFSNILLVFALPYNWRRNRKEEKFYVEGIRMNVFTNSTEDTVMLKAQKNIKDLISFFYSETLLVLLPNFISLWTKLKTSKLIFHNTTALRINERLLQVIVMLFLIKLWY